VHDAEWYARAIATRYLSVWRSTIDSRLRLPVRLTCDPVYRGGWWKGVARGGRVSRSEETEFITMRWDAAARIFRRFDRFVHRTSVISRPNSSISRQEQTAIFMIIDCRSQRRQTPDKWEFYVYARASLISPTLCFVARDCSILRRLHVSSRFIFIPWDSPLNFPISRV